MTAEIAILNKHGIALASDSAVTMSGDKIKTSANKLFALSKFHPVGIMIFGNAELMGIPWETIIKIYRIKLGKKKFEQLNGYAEDFLKFLDCGNPLFPDSVQEEFLLTTVYYHLYYIEEEIEKEVNSVILENDKITQKEAKKIISTIIKKHYEEWKNAEFISSIPKNHTNDIIEKYGEKIDEAIDEVFQNLPIYKRHFAHLKEIAANLFSKFHILSDHFSGIVIAGFGEKDVFPSIKAYAIEGMVLNKLKYTEYSTDEVNFKTNAYIISFAQDEMVVTFMEGIDPYYRKLEEDYLNEIFSEYVDFVTDNLTKYDAKDKIAFNKILDKISHEILTDYREKLERYRKEVNADSIINVVSMLPKDELAAMAEALVNLTSFKRKVSMQTETVGGPIDVAVISKGDGFIWIKRKHYFKPDLNPQYFSNYYREEIENGEESEN
ncbi:MAG: hypothetical protein E4G94_01515 [ANME-2 cluster archaeon]|nr:MAG: hypothetical protein E4G94_01515 [ANME-2 cluster archaeon]